jgi:hypothetical protein
MVGTGMDDEHGWVAGSWEWEMEDGGGGCARFSHFILSL